jgi:TetR/AcrR family transcriptional repressor of nem operon
VKTSLKNRRPATRRRPPGDAATAILDIAEQLAQTRGFNGFSYADIAAELGVTKASLHYHFRSKSELGCALIERYEATFEAALESIDRAVQDPWDKLRRYVEIYDAVVRNDRMCLCGMLAAEYATLPAPMQEELRQFFDLNERWLADVLQHGRRTGTFLYKESASDRARVIVGALEGAMLVARSYGDPRRFQAAAEHVLEDLGVGKPSQHSRRARPRLATS